MEISTENYLAAWQRLKTRFEIKRLIIKKHVRALFELLPVPKDNHTKLRQLLDGVLKYLRSLKTLGRPTEYWDDMLIYLAAEKLDVTTNKEWEDSLTGDVVPTFEMFIDFLEHRYITLEVVDRKGHTQLVSSSQPKGTHSKTASHVSTNKASCQVCKGNHFIFSCEQFLKLLPEARFKCVKEHKLCSNCLRFSSHTAKICRASSCKTCGNVTIRYCT